jgi:hypothetical protein
MQVQKVTDAVQLVKEARPDLMVEGPLQYDAAIDPTVAAVKIKTQSEVAGRATVFIFPDLNTGNNTYKAVQQVRLHPLSVRCYAHRRLGAECESCSWAHVWLSSKLGRQLSQ